MIYHLLCESEMFSEQRGGAISRWAANVLKDGEEVVICPSSDSSWGFADDRVYCMPNWSRTSPIHPLLYRLPWFLQKKIYLHVFEPLLQRIKPGDVIYIHNAPETASVLATVADKHNIKVVLHMHNSHLVRANKGQLAALKNRPIVFCSQFLRKEVGAALPEHFETVHVVYNGADDKKFYLADREEARVPTIIFTGRLISYKGVHILIKAMRVLERRRIAAKCKIVGRTYFARNKSTRYSRYLQRIKPANTEMVGYKSGRDLAELLQKADIFCCPSIWNDPFPLAPLEAMATGLPVVSSNTGGLPEMLAWGGGIMVPPNNVKALADALERLVINPAYRKQLGAEAMAAFREHFLWGSVRSQYEAVIQQVMS
jgi:spore coat protein SA